MAVDSDSMISLLGREQLAEWQRTPAEALEQAMSNLRRKSDKPMQELQPGLYISDWDDSYESSRLLVPDVLHRARLKGELVAMAPVRDVLMITGHRDLEGLAMMAHAAADCMKEGRWVTFQMLRHREGSWERFIPEGPAGDELRRLQVDERATREHTGALVGGRRGVRGADGPRAAALAPAVPSQGVPVGRAVAGAEGAGRSGGRSRRGVSLPMRHGWAARESGDDGASLLSTISPH